MSEVQKFKCIGYMVQRSRVGGAEYVSLADLDRVTAERDAALEEVEALKHWRDLALQFDNHRMKALWHLKTLVSDGAHYDAAAAFLAEPPVPASELQQRLTAADERADVLETEVARLNRVKLALKELVESHAGNLSVYRYHLSETLVMAEKVRGASLGMQRKCLADLIDYLHQSGAALKPAEVGGDDRPNGCCCPPKGFTGLWAGASCPIHQGLRAIKQ